MNEEDVRLSFVGGPWDGDTVDSFLAKLMSYYQPPYFCVGADGRYEHYIRVDRTTFQHAGGCRAIVDHPDCGHDHTEV